MRPVLSDSLPTACTFRSGPYLSQLAYTIAPFGPLVFLQVLMYVSCVSVHARCIAWHITVAYTLFFFEIRWRTEQPRPCHFVLFNYNYQGVDSPTRPTQQQFSSSQWPKIWIKCTNCRLSVWQYRRGKQCLCERLWRLDFTAEDDGQAKLQFNPALIPQQLASVIVQSDSRSICRHTRPNWRAGLRVC